MLAKSYLSKVFFLLLAFYFGLNQGSVSAQGIVRGYPQTNGRIFAMATKNDTLFIAGNFTSVYNADSIASFGTIIHPQTGKPASSFDQPNGPVFAATPDKKGGYFVGGNFSKVGNEKAVRLAHLDSLGALSNLSVNTHVNGVVKALATLGDTLFIGGQFSLIGDFVETSGAPVFRHTNWVSTSFPAINGDVWCAIPDGVGGWYISGNFTQVGGIARNRAARIDGNGNVLAWNPNIDGIPYAMILYQNRVYIGGSFSNVGAMVRSGIASVDTASGAVSAWAPGAPSTVVRSFSLFNNTLYVAGAFNSMGGSSRANLAAFSMPAATLTSFTTTMASFGASLNTVFALGSKVFVGGTFSTIGGLSRSNLAALDINTGFALSNWSANTNGSVNKVLYLKGHIYAGGTFTTVASTTRNYLAAADTTTGALHSFSPSLNGYVNCMEMGTTDSTLYLSGAFSNWYYSYNLKNFTGNPWPLKANYFANTLSLVGARLFVGGSFTSLGGIDRTNLAAIRVSTGEVLPWSPNANARVEAICNVKDSFIFIGGYFSQVAGNNRSYLASFNRSGSLTTFSFAINDYVRAIAFSGDSILYFGGNFTNVATVSPFISILAVAQKMAALNFRTGRIQPTWNPNANNAIYSILVDGNTVYAGGTFSAIGGQTRNFVGAVNRTTASATSFNAGISTVGTSVNSLAKFDQNLIVGGSFYYYVNTLIVRRNLASFNVSTNQLNTFINEPDLQVNCLSLYQNKIYCGGDFTLLGAFGRNNVAAFIASTGRILDFDLGTSTNFGNDGVYSMHWADDYLFLGGNFTTVGDLPRNKFGVIHIPSKTVHSFDPNPNGIIYSIYVHQGYLYLGGQFTNIASTNRNRLALFNYPNFTLNAANPNFSGWPLSYAGVNSGKIIMGGSWTTIGAQTAAHCAAFQLPAFNRITGTPVYNNSVSMVSLVKNQLFLGGNFTTIGGQSRPNFAILDTATLLPTAFSSTISGGVTCFAVSEGGNAYMAGNFNTLGGTSRSVCGSISTTTGLANNWYPLFTNPAPNAPNVRSILTIGNKVFLGGQFNKMNGISLNNLAVVYGNDTAVNISSVAGGGSICQGAQITVNYTVTSNFATGNQFIVELVDTALPFKPALQIANLTSVSGGSINANLPWTMPTNRYYYIQIRSTNPVSISKTAGTLVQTVNCTPTLGPQSLQFSNTTLTSTTLSWTKGNGQKCLVIARYGAMVNALPVNGTSYLANSNFGMGDSLAPGQYVVYNGTGNTVNVSNLNVWSNYHFAVIEYNGDNLSSGYLNNQVLHGSATTLPVKWLQFNAIKEEPNVAQLSWSTASEINNAYFLIERKFSEESSFQIVGKTKGNGTVFTRSNYTFIDPLDAEAQAKASIYYRLKQVDYDGQFEYSNTVILKDQNALQDKLEIHPNPFSKELLISFGSNQIFGYKIYNLNGKLVQQESFNKELTPGKQTPLISISTESLHTGIYFIELNTQNGFIRSKILKNE